MPVVVFKGRTLPAIAKINFPEVAISWGTQDLGFKLNMRAIVSDSQVQVICDLPQFEDDYIRVILKRAYNLAEGVVDVAAFGFGLAISVHLETVVKPDGTEQTLIMQDRDLAQLCTAFKFPPRNHIENFEFGQVMTKVFAEPDLLASIHDLAEILGHYEVTPTNCGRVLDSLRRGVAPQLDKKKGWAVLKAIVNADDNYMTWVSALSADPRHGDRTTLIPERDIRELRIRTWTVMNRMLEYRKRGDKPLDPTQFPLLVHDPTFLFPKPQS